MNLLDDISQIPSTVKNFVADIFEMFGSIIDALLTFYQMLDDFDKTIVAMTESCGSSEFTGMPIMDAIGMIRYLVGDIVFYMIYAGILIGCLFVVYKLVVLLYEGLDALVETMSGGKVTCSSFFNSLVNRLFK